MFIEENFYCWPEGKTEGDAKPIKAPNPKEAAKIAVDIWRHEGDLHQDQIMVYVRDSEDEIHKIIINKERFEESNPPS